ncbi:hypothetical protein I302_100410 [Kwoniella bestiolae CBS 10118]|uniref:Uncharacterized protein n=1 Tax=Kwoniella bestiolae CBS 10118 TaxID=1296100 RepID=A0A1B9G528_9TREE|nr:hypothetical protein I302_03785 [Kwoniella bestiolae CBS 10118]OCF26108.1 hypothetical protein I302_03785 [Kwoniella bestiolae CBS 10118]
MPPKKTKPKTSYPPTTSTSQSPPNPPSISFSNHIIQRILSYIPVNEQGTLHSCTLVDKQFNLIATPLLWRWLILSPPSEADEITPINPIDTSVWKDERLKMVKILSIETHSSEWCTLNQSANLKLPNLETIRLTIHKKFGYPRAFHSFPTSEPPPSQISNQSACTLMKHLKPRTIVYKETPDSSFYLNPDNVSPPIWSKVDTLIFLIPPVGAGTHFTKNKDLTQLVPKLKRVYWIFDPTDVDLTSRYNTGNFDHDEINFLSNLLVRNPKIKFTIVNAGCTSLRLPKKYRMSIEDSEDSYQESFIKNHWNRLEEAAFDARRSKLRAKAKAGSGSGSGSGSGPGSKRQEKDGDRDSNDEEEEEEEDEEVDSSYEFMSIGEFVEKEEWYNWFDPEEIVRWKRINEEIDGKKEKGKNKK